MSPRDGVTLAPPGWPRPRLPDREGVHRPAPWITETPDFASMDPDRGALSITERLCQVCGEGHEPGADVIIFLDGPLRDARTRERLESRGPLVNFLHVDVTLKALDQAIMHERCARLAAGACPQLRRMRAEGRLFGFVGPVESIEHAVKPSSDGVDEVLRDALDVPTPTTVYMAAEAARPWALPEQAARWMARWGEPEQLPPTDQSAPNEGSPMYQIFPGKDGDHYWRQLGGNGEEIARSSEGYESEEGARKALDRSLELAAESQGQDVEVLAAEPGGETA